ncbi:hypothetical protein JL720_7487 [Aureococcus anophagefferens]|nr:hypothetical protein JL720_7487 [Aureococcus anophagefferens]
MRVRAYSARVCDDGASFNVTVKIYPGGPPAAGTLPLGGALDVPQVRSLRWAVPLAELGNVGIIAFGVGVAEAVEAVEDVLAASAAVVCLFAAYRDGSQILYRDHFRALLAAHPGRLRIRYTSRGRRRTRRTSGVGEETVPRRLGGCSVGDRELGPGVVALPGHRHGVDGGAAWSWLGILGFEGGGSRATRAGATSARPEPALPARRARRAGDRAARRRRASQAVVWCRPWPDRGAVDGGRAGGELLAALFRTIKHDEAGGERAENVREAVMFALHEVETLTDRCTEHFTRHIVKSQASRVIERRLVKSAENLTKVVRVAAKFECFGSSDKLRMTHKILRQLGKEADKLEGERTRPEKRKADEAKAPEPKKPKAESPAAPLIPCCSRTAAPRCLNYGVRTEKVKTVLADLCAVMEDERYPTWAGTGAAAGMAPPVLGRDRLQISTSLRGARSACSRAPFLYSGLTSTQDPIPLVAAAVLVANGSLDPNLRAVDGWLSEAARPTAAKALGAGVAQILGAKVDLERANDELKAYFTPDLQSNRKDAKADPGPSPPGRGASARRRRVSRLGDGDVARYAARALASAAKAEDCAKLVAAGRDEVANLGKLARSAPPPATASSADDGVPISALRPPATACRRDGRQGEQARQRPRPREEEARGPPAGRKRKAD